MKAVNSETTLLLLGCSTAHVSRHFFFHPESMQGMGLISLIAHHFHILYIQVMHFQVEGLSRQHETRLEMGLISENPSPGGCDNFSHYSSSSS